MKGFLSLFVDSAKELKNIRTITTTGLLMAFSIALRGFAIQITPDVRITFSFVAIAIIAMLFGPVVAGMAGFGTDLIGFLFDKTGNAYYPPLALVAILSGVIYGIFLYRKDITQKSIIIRSVISKTLVTVVCSMILNSILIYTAFVNTDFVFNSSNIHHFMVWVSPRIIKNIIMLPISIFLLSITLPVVYQIYNKIAVTYRKKKV